jgi:hypothetical protein
MAKAPVRFSKLKKILKPFGVVEVSGGKGSETILQRPDPPGSRKGPQFTIKKHGKDPEIDWRVIVQLLERFGIPEDAIWTE